MGIGDRPAETKNENHNLARLLRNAQREAMYAPGTSLRRRWRATRGLPASSRTCRR